VIRLKRVTKELRRSKKLLQIQQKAGLASARNRLTAVPTDVGTTVGTALQPRKGNEKRSEIEREENNITNTNSNTNTFNCSLSSSTSVRLRDILHQITFRRIILRVCS
jgi:hypothetical protein